MNILVCFKVVPDLDMLSDNDWTKINQCNIDTSFVRKMINPFDESALELVLKLKDKANKKIDNSLILTALTIGSHYSERTLKNLYALKYDNAVRINCNKDIRFDSNFIANIIAGYIKNICNQEVVILGNQSGEGDNAKTPFILAEILDIPCISDVISMELTEGNNLIKVTSNTDNYIIEQVVKTPIILSIGNVQNSYIRVPTLKDKMASKNKEIYTYNIVDLGFDEKNLKIEDEIELVELNYYKSERVCEFITGKDANEKAKKIYYQYLKERLKF